MSYIDYTKVRRAIEAAEAKAKELGIAVSVAVVDEYGDLLAFNRMQGAIKVSPKFAIAKAYTAGTIGLSTLEIAKYSGEGKPLYGFESLCSGELTTIAGGLPVKNGDKLVGGVGVGGSYDVNQDQQCAEAALNELV